MEERLVTETLLPKFIQNFVLKVMKSVFLCILLDENYCLKACREIKFIYRVMHGCIEFKLKMSDRQKSFPCFFDNTNWAVKSSWLCPPQSVESTEKRVWNFLNFILQRKRNRRKKDQALYDDQVLALFLLANFLVYVEWKDIRVIDISASERQNCILHLLVLEFRVV